MTLFVVLFEESWFVGTKYTSVEATVGVYDTEEMAKQKASEYKEEYLRKHFTDRTYKELWIVDTVIHTVELNQTREVD